MCDGDDCCKTVAKVILIIVNLFFVLLGLLMLAFGIVMVVAPDKVTESVFSGVDLDLLGDYYYAAIIRASKGIFIFMIVLGGIVAYIGSFGFVGACCENQILLILYLIIVIIILLAEVALIIYAALISASIQRLFNDAVIKAVNDTMIKNYYQDIKIYADSTIVVGDGYEFGLSWAATQLGAKCCGLIAPSDYDRYSVADRTTLVYGQNMTFRYPISCCKVKDGVKFPPKSASDFVDLDGCRVAANNTYNNKGCYDATGATLRQTISQVARIAIGIAAAIVGLAILIIVFGFVLCCALKRRKSLTV